MNKEKIQKLIVKMLEEQEKISSVTRDNSPENSEEYYFTYPDDKYQWSILKTTAGIIHIFFYPSKEKRSEFLRFESDDMTAESGSNLKSLFETVRGKLFGFDSVLDDILG